MGITYGDYLIDSGYYDITPEQEREIEMRRAVKIKTWHEYPSIPIREFDYGAIDENTYDPDPECKGCIVGWGSTPEAAIADLMERLEEQ